MSTQAQGEHPTGGGWGSPVLAGAAVILVGLAVATLWPSASGHVNGLGYRSLCPFAPTSSFMLAVAAIGAWMWRATLGRSAPPDEY